MYIINNENKLYYKNELILTNNQVVNALKKTNEAMKELDDATNEFDVNIFEILQLRNLSGLVGEYLSKLIEIESEERLVNNPHQDGYPDLLDVGTKIKRDYYDSLFLNESNSIYKEHVSPFKYGGIEVKATIGSTPPAKKVAKPLVGEQRIAILNGLDWKSHHRETNNLIGILWDFIDGLPFIVGCFYSNELTEEDWGNIVSPKKGGGRTTSVSVMNASGIKKMCSNWIAIVDDSQYTKKLSANRWIGYDVKN